MSIILPYYNEKWVSLKDTIIKVNSCYGNKEIIVIDDGSKDKTCYKNLIKLQQDIPFKLIRYERNKGKRYAQLVGFKKAIGDIIITLDSDTILDKNALIELVKPFINKKVGATTGQLEVSNKVNLLTKIQAARYWNAFNFERNSQSKVNALICCSGPISAYRKEIIDKISFDYSNQEFLGKKCTFGDDRHLTTLILKLGYDVKYVKKAIGYTEAPTTWKKFIKQQTRWKKSWLRETYLVSKFMFKRGGFLPFEILVTTFMTLFSVFARIGLIITIIAQPLYIFQVLLMILIMGIIHSLYVLFYKKEYFFYSLIYGFIHVFFIYWLVFYALFTFNNTKWGTR